jgi:hypothetical protein
MSNLIIPGLAFAIASSPATFKLTRKVVGPWVSSFEGVATPAGLFLHTLFFLLVLYLVGRFLPKVFPRVSGFGDMLGGATSYGKGHETHREGLGTMDESPNLSGFDIDTKQ